MNLVALLLDWHRAWKAPRRNERAGSSAMLGLDRPDDIVLDVGAHKASDFYWLRQSAKPAGHVPALEPQPVLAAYLREMIAAKRRRNL